jgi:predicted O-methyltransferase YrrM
MKMDTYMTNLLNRQIFHPDCGNLVNFEGNITQIPQQKEDLLSIVQQYRPRKVLEIGFNCGHSSELFLDADPDLTVTSFDIGTHQYTSHGKLFIDNHYPGRHTLILGDSTKTIPTFYKNIVTESLVYDFFFIDGGHDEEIAKADMENCHRMAKQNNQPTLVILDDTMSNLEWVEFWNQGPNAAWKNALQSGMIQEIDSKDYGPGKGMSWGYYI